MSKESDISRDLIVNSIKEIISKADLNVMTPKLVRFELQNRLKLDLSSRREEIKLIINEIINDLNNNINDNKINIKTNDKNNDNNQRKSISKSVESISTNNCEIDSKKSSNIKSKSDVESSESSDESIGDEELARKLQKEELDSKQRVTRNTSNRSNRKKTITKKSSKKKKKVDCDDSDDNKSQKKKKNGYLKPCTLSPELALFLGESEMPRHEVVKRIWSYVKEKNLMDPKNKQFAICDNELLKIFGNRKRIRLFGMMKHLTKHLE